MPRKDLTSYPKKVGYKKHSGYVAWILHRVTGVVLVLYFVFHMLGSTEVCPFLADFVKIRAVEAVLLASLIFHGLNGMRLILMEFANASERKTFRKYALATFGLSVILIAVGFIPLFY